jgi:integrase
MDTTNASGRAALPRPRPGKRSDPHAGSSVSNRGGAVSTGVRKIHQRTCASHRGARCRCGGGWEAWVWDAAADKKIRKTFPSEPAAKAWRVDTTKDVRLRVVSAAPSSTLREAGDQLVEGMRSGAIRRRGGEQYKPSVIAGYADVLRLHVYPRIGERRLSAITRNDVQDLVDHLVADKKSPGTIRNVLMPVRVIYRRAVQRAIAAVNPTTALDLPTDRGRGTVFVEPADAAALIAALEPSDRAAWAIALYAGLRLGEWRALRWEDVDLDAAELHVRRAYCTRARDYIEPKSAAARRTVPVPAELRRLLLEHRLSSGRRHGLIVGDGATVEDRDRLQHRSERAWKAAGLSPITPHAARHSYASIAIAAGVQAKALQTFMGHESITTTLNRYGHLYTSERAAAVAQIDRLLAASGVVGG